MAEASIDVSEKKRSGQVEQDGKGQKLSFDEIREETLKTEQQVLTLQTQLTALCDLCFFSKYTKISALYLCYLCKQYLCARCRERHERSHSMVEIESKRGERETSRREFLGGLRNESKLARKVMFNREDVSLIDRVSVRHELDKSDNYWINGICGLDGTRWVICDFHNSCIKVFSIGSHLLQRYIRLGSEPYGVTAINVEQELTSRINVQKVNPLKRFRAAINTFFSVKRKPTEQGVMVASDISEPNQSKPDKQCLLAVTLPGKRIILFINLTQNPAVITNSLKTKKPCWDIAFSGDQIVTLCNDKYPSGYGPWFITVLSTGGVELKTINTPRDLYRPSLAVCPGRFYLTDWLNDKVLCMNDEGKVVFSSNTIRWSRPGGISVDPDTEKVYISRLYDSTLSRLDSRLESRESLFKFKKVDEEEWWPYSLCVYRDRVYVSFGRIGGSSVVSVVRVI